MDVPRKSLIDRLERLTEQQNERSEKVVNRTKTRVRDRKIDCADTEMNDREKERENVVGNG